MLANSDSERRGETGLRKTVITGTSWPRKKQIGGELLPATRSPGSSTRAACAGCSRSICVMFWLHIIVKSFLRTRHGSVEILVHWSRTRHGKRAECGNVKIFERLLDFAKTMFVRTPPLGGKTMEAHNNGYDHNNCHTNCTAPARKKKR